MDYWYVFDTDMCNNRLCLGDLRQRFLIEENKDSNTRPKRIKQNLLSLPFMSNSHQVNDKSDVPLDSDAIESTQRDFFDTIDVSAGPLVQYRQKNFIFVKIVSLSQQCGQDNALNAKSGIP